MLRWEMAGIGRDMLQLTEREIPSVGPGEVLVRVDAVSLNYRDKLMIDSGLGLPLAFPFTPASDLAGEVVTLGEGATRFKPGDRVISTFVPGWLDGRPGGNARIPPFMTLGGGYPGVLSEYVAFPEDWFVTAPNALDPGEASTLPCTGLTAWVALVERGNIHAGQTILVQGTGSVSLFALQIAKAHGATVMVVTSSVDKAARTVALGADWAVDRNSEDWVDAVYRETDDHGVDHILEMAGGANFGRSIAAVAFHGRVSVIGFLDAADINALVGPILLKSPTIQGIGVGHRRSLEDLVTAIDRIGIKPVIDRRYAFDDLPAALDHLDRGAFGKIVIDVH